jgi:protocatechuate 3,4-dioxygenase beta subunit
VSGVVTTANDVPLPRVRVAIPVPTPAQLASMGARMRPERIVLTDARGHFSIPIAASRSTALEFSKARYMTQVMTLSPRELSAGGSELRVRMSLGGAVSGQVVDRFGGGLMSATVTLRRASTGKDDPPVAITTTNDRGDYRFGGLAPGRYVATAVPPVSALDVDIPDRQKLVDAAAAQGPAVDVGAGSDVNGIVLTVDPPSEANLASRGRTAGAGATASVSGRVVGADGLPIARALVHAHRPYIAGQQAETDQSGRYHIDGLVAGEYTIAVRKFGFESRQYGQESGTAVGRLVTLKDGQSVNALDVTLLRPGAISGTIVDEFGEPVQDVMVGAVQLQPNPGGARGTRVIGRSSSRTDDRGQYRLSGLAPGAYFVQAAVEGDLPAGTGYLPRLYPGVTAFDQATETKVDFGTEVRGVDFAVSATETYRVTGRVWDASGNVARGSVSLAVSERSGTVQAQARSMNIGPDGSFEFTNVGPGDYVVQASAASRVPITSGRPTTTAIQFAMSYVTIRGSEPPPVDLRLTHGATLIGRVRYEGLTPGPSPLLTIETLGADRDRTSVLFSGSQSADVQPDGTFEIMSVFGPTLIQAQPQRSDWYVKSVFFKGQDIVDTPFDFGSGAFRDIEVVISTTGATVTGRVIDDRSAPVRDYAVFVFPTFRDLWFVGSRWVKGLRAASLDRPFVLTGLPPGDYWVAAFDPPENAGPMAGMSGTRPTPVSDPSLLQSLSSRATRITLGEGQTQDVTLRVIRR